MTTFIHGLYDGSYQAILPDPRAVGPGPGAASSLFIVRDLSLWSLARASRLYYRGLAPDEGVPQAPESDTWQPFLVRVPFRSYGRNPYLHNTTQDFDAPLLAEAETLTPYLVRVPFRRFGLNPYVWATARDVEVEEAATSQILRRILFRSLGRNPYLWNLAQEDAVAPAEPDVLASFLVRRSIQGILRVIPGYVFSPPQDFDAPPGPVVPGEFMVVIPDTPGATRVRVVTEHPTQGRVLISSANKVVVTQNPGDPPVQIIKHS